MSHHETPQKRERLQELQKPTLSPNSPYLYSPYLSPPLATSTKKETKPEAEEGSGGEVETTLEGRTEKPEASSSSVSSPRMSQAGDEEPGGGGGGATVVVLGAVVTSGAGGIVSEASAAEICSVIARR
jgi:hypothetical protein